MHIETHYLIDVAFSALFIFTFITQKKKLDKHEFWKLLKKPESRYGLPCTKHSLVSRQLTMVMALLTSLFLIRCPYLVEGCTLTWQSMFSTGVYFFIRNYNILTYDVVELLLRKYEVYDQECEHHFLHELNPMLCVIFKLHDFTSFPACFAHLMNLCRFSEIWSKLKHMHERLLLTFAKVHCKVPCRVNITKIIEIFETFNLLQ